MGKIKIRGYIRMQNEYNDRITLFENGQYIMHVQVEEDASDEDKFLAICNAFERNMDKLSNMPPK